MKHSKFKLQTLKREDVIGLFLVLIVVTVYHLIFINRYFPIQEGWFSVYAHEILNGKFPYRDFYLFLQPLYPIEVTFLIHLFGNDFIVFRIIGLIERLLLTTVIFLIFKRIFSVTSSVLVVLTTIAFFSSSFQDLIYSYYQTCLLYGLWSVYFINIFYENHDKKYNNIFIIISGILSSLSFLTKQSTGLLIPIAILLYLVFTLKKDIKKKSSILLLYIFGITIPIATVLYWLLYNDAIYNYIEQVYVGGISSKGTLVHILFGFYEKTFNPNYLLSFIVLTVLFLFLKEKKKNNNNVISNKTNNITVLTIIIISLFCFIFPLYFLNPLGVIYKFINFPIFKNIIINYCFFFSAILIIYLIFKLRKEYKEINSKLLLLGLVSFAIMYAHGFSYKIEEQATIISFGLFCGIILECNIKFKNIKNKIVYLTCFIIISLCAFQKFACPYTWWGWKEPSINQAVESSDLKLLNGFRLSRTTKELLGEINLSIIKNTEYNENIFTFPNIPVFYLTSERYPNTFALVHYFDVCPDLYAKRDAEILKMLPPKVIIYFEYPENVWDFHEKYFRNNNVSGQREIDLVINQLMLSEQLTCPQVLYHQIG